MTNLKYLINKIDEVKEINKINQYQMLGKGRLIYQQKLYKTTQRRKI